MKKSSLFCKAFLLALLAALAVTVFAMGVSAEEYAAYYYVDGANGSDKNDGLTPSTPVETFSGACLKAAKESDTAAIVIMNDFALTSGITEPVAHDNLFVITTKDKTTDYGTQGAKIVMGTSQQFHIAGPTKFENVTFDFTSAITFVANYHALAFGEGMVFNKLSNGGNGVYVYGGWRKPTNDMTEIAQDSHLSFESGDYYLVVAGSRERGTENTGKTSSHKIFEGTHYVDIKGGNIAILYGGSHTAHASHACVITMTGGTVGKLGVAGDASRRLNGDAIAEFRGGEIRELQVRNVIGEAHITLAGTKIGTLDLSCYNEEVRKMEEDANKKKFLYYDANFYTDAEIATFGANFDVVENATYVYASANGKGAGTSESDAASFKDAFTKVAATGGVVLVLDSITLTDFAEPAHAGKVDVCGKDASVKLTLSGTYTLSGETEFSEITLAGDASINAANGKLAVAADAKVSSKFNITGSAALYAGSYGKITAAGDVLVDGATVDAVVGGTDALNVEVHAGKIASLETAQPAIKNATINISGGEISKLTFRGVTDSLTLMYYGGKITATAVENVSAKGVLTLGDGITVESLGDAAALFTEKAERVVFVKDGGTGSGVSAAAPTTPEEGFKLLASGGTMVVVGEFTSSSATFTQAAAYTGKVTITSLYDGVDYRAQGARIVLKASFHLGGDTDVDHVSIVSQGTNAALFCGYNDVTFGADIQGSYEGTVTTYPCIVTGTKANSENLTGTVTINGGTWQRLRLGNSGGSPKGVTSNVVINGGAFHGYVFLSSTSTAGRTHDGASNLTINAGTFYAGILGVSATHADAKYTVDNNITVNGGRIYNVIRAQGIETVAGITGKFTVNLYGGDFSHMTDIIGPNTDGCVGTLNVGDNIDLDANLTGTYQFTNYLQSAADPWVFYHDGAYYMTKTGGREIRLWKSANLGDLAHGVSTVIYAPPSGYDFSKDLWSPEIHFLTDEEAGGAGLGGWYLFVGGQSETVTNFSGIRAFVLKAKDPNNLQGEWVNPVTGEVNMPQKLEFPGTDYNVKESCGGSSILRINGKAYLTFVTSVGRDTIGTDNYYFYQKIMICDIVNPWTITNPVEICRPTTKWERGGATSTHPEVVECSTAFYGEEGDIYVVYSGSGYWTEYYCLMYLKYQGGDPKDPANWVKNPEPFFLRSDEINGNGHGCYVTDADGQKWVVYHAYIGKDANDIRYAFAEPVYSSEAKGIWVGDGSGKPAPMSTVYTCSVNPQPIRDKLSNFTNINTVAGKAKTVNLTIGASVGYINNADFPLDAAPVIENSRTMLPIRFVAEALGATVGWDGATSSVTITTDTTKIELKVGASTAKVNGVEQTLDAPSFIQNSRTYLPVRFVAEALGAKVEWDGTTSTATLIK